MFIFMLCAQILKDGLSAVHVPYSYGFAIILLTVIVKLATLPLTKQQVSFIFVFHVFRAVMLSYWIEFRWTWTWKFEFFLPLDCCSVEPFCIRICRWNLH